MSSLRIRSHTGVHPNVTAGPVAKTTRWYDADYENIYWYDTITYEEWYDPETIPNYIQFTLDETWYEPRQENDLRDILPEFGICLGKRDALNNVRSLSAHIAAIGLLKELGTKIDTRSSCRTAVYLTRDTHRGDMPIVIDTGCSISVTPF